MEDRLVFWDSKIYDTEVGINKNKFFTQYTESEILAQPNVISIFLNVCSIIYHTISLSAYCGLSWG